jgi:hypothetical protein
MAGTCTSAFGMLKGLCFRTVPVPTVFVLKEKL